MNSYWHKQLQAKHNEITRQQYEMEEDPFDIVMVTHFNNDTYEEFEKQFNTTKDQYTYNTCKLISTSNIPTARKVVIYVIEMNNQTNKIVGFGKIEKNPIIQPAKIYSQGRFNMYGYPILNRIQCNDMNQPRYREHQKYIEEIERLLFTGKQHCKRGSGIHHAKLVSHDEDTLLFLHTLLAHPQS